MNFAPLKLEDYGKIKNDVQKLDVIFRTGGTVANYANPYSKNGYGFSFWELFFKGTSTLWAWFWLQLRFNKNYLDIIGSVIEGKKVIYVVNLSKPVEHVKFAIDKLVNQHGCTIEAIELGNEQYLGFYNVSPEQYVNQCKKFQEEFEGKYRILWQLSQKNNQNWNEMIINAPGIKSYCVHHYNDPVFLGDFATMIGYFLDLVGKNFYVTEWNLQGGVQLDENYYFNVNKIKGFLQLMEEEGIKNCFHNVAGDTFGVWKDDLTIKQKLFDLFPKV